jgi:hypothetical protein
MILNHIDNVSIKGLGIDVVLPVGKNEVFDDDVVELDFMETLKYYNAYLLKVKELNEEEFHDRGNIYALSDAEKENEDWLNDYELVHPHGWPSIRKKTK